MCMAMAMMFDYRNQSRVARTVPPARPQKEGKVCNTVNDEVGDSEALDMACAAAVPAADPVCELAMPVRLLHKAALTFKHCVLPSAFTHVVHVVCSSQTRIFIRWPWLSSPLLRSLSSS